MDDPRYPRFSSERVLTALKDTPAVVLNGPRQCGKTTLVRSVGGPGRIYLTLDDATTLASARADPVGLLRKLDRVTLDEVQRAPDLLLAIKRSIDENRAPGRFLLTGSADLLTLRQLSDSLAGRMEVITLLPLSEAELGGRRPRFLKDVFEGHVPAAATVRVTTPLLQRIVDGGYPERLTRHTTERRRAWATQYLNAVLQRDIRDVAEVARLDDMPRLLRALGHCSAQLLNFEKLGGELHLDGKTTRRYVTILEQLFLVRRLEAWSQNGLSRLIKAPKLHFLDSGLLATLLGTSASRLEQNRQSLGPLLETFVFAELSKQAGWLEESCRFNHYRDKDQDEVDLVLESPHGEVVGIEVKAAASVNSSDFKGLRKLARATGRSFRCGVVLYDGPETLPFGDRLQAAPFSSLWS